MVLEEENNTRRSEPTVSLDCLLASIIGAAMARSGYLAAHAGAALLVRQSQQLTRFHSVDGPRPRYNWQAGRPGVKVSFIPMGLGWAGLDGGDRPSCSIWMNICIRQLGRGLGAFPSPSPPFACQHVGRQCLSFGWKAGRHTKPLITPRREATAQAAPRTADSLDSATCDRRR